MLTENSDLGEQIWMEDILSLDGDTVALWKTMYRTVERVKHQDAPVALINELVKLNDMYGALHKGLENVSKFFPRQP